MAAPLFRGKHTLDPAALSMVTQWWEIEAFPALESEAGPLSRVYKSQTPVPGFPKAALSCVIIVTKEGAEGACCGQETVQGSLSVCRASRGCGSTGHIFSPFPAPVR